RHFEQTGGWGSGDFNYDGSINLSDFVALTRHFGQSLAPTLSASDLLLPASPDLNRLAARRVRR
ncbi:MAG TPA: hypothetical protein VN541_10030, partial [Tepidisphaeraceae bacterium]|nr:hypothetical protein [Tepidisphaeraceae bacterium]